MLLPAGKTASLFGQWSFGISVMFIRLIEMLNTKTPVTSLLCVNVSHTQRCLSSLPHKTSQHTDNHTLRNILTSIGLQPNPVAAIRPPLKTQT